MSKTPIEIEGKMYLVDYIIQPYSGDYTQSEYVKVMKIWQRDLSDQPRTEVHPLYYDSFKSFIGKEIGDEVWEEVSCCNMICIGDCEKAGTTYAISTAIPVPANSEDVWEEAIEWGKQQLIGRTYSDSVEYYENLLWELKQHYTLIKKK